MAKKKKKGKKKANGKAPAGSGLAEMNGIKDAGDVEAEDDEDEDDGPDPPVVCVGHGCGVGRSLVANEA